MTEEPILTGIDHPVIAVRDMAAAHAAYERLGFTITPRGSHREWGTGNWCIMFARDYLELRGKIDAGKHSHHLDSFLKKREGLMGVAFGTQDAQASHDALVASKLHPQPVQQLTRNFELPEGAVQPRFSLCFQDPDETPGLMSVVLCQHLTPELLRRPEWLQHKNGSHAVAAMTGVVADLKQAAAKHEKLFGAHAVVRQSDRVSIRVGVDQQIVLMISAAAAEEFANLDVEVETETGHLCSVVLRVLSLVATKEYFESQGIEYREAANNAIHTLPHEACGVLFKFIQ